MPSIALPEDRLSQFLCWACSSLQYDIFSISVPVNNAVPETLDRQMKDSWFVAGEQFISDGLKLKQINKKAKNVILFLGDGMGISTVTAARILQGQLNGKTGRPLICVGLSPFDILYQGEYV